MPPTTITPKIPLIDRHWVIRLLEIIPGAVTWTTIALPIVLSFLSPIAVAYFIIAFDLYWTVKAFHISYSLFRAYGRLHATEKIDWTARLKWLSHPAASLDKVTTALDVAFVEHPGDHKLSLIHI